MRNCTARRQSLNTLVEGSWYGGFPEYVVLGEEVRIEELKCGGL